MAMTDGFVRRGLGLVGSALPRPARRPRLRAAPVAPQAASEEQTVPEALARRLDAPLGHIAGAAELLLDTPLGPLQQSYVRGIVGWSEDMRLGIDRLLGRSTAEPAEPINLADLVGAVARLIAVPAREKGVRFVSHVEPDVPPLPADLPALRQLLVRLCVEALKRTPSGVVALRALRVTGGVRIVVMDCGGPHAAGEQDDAADAVFGVLAARLDAEIETLRTDSGGSVRITLPLRDDLVPDISAARDGFGPAGIDALLERLSRELLAGA